MCDPASNPEIAEDHVIPRSDHAAVGSEKIRNGGELRFCDHGREFCENGNGVVSKYRAEQDEERIHREHRFSIFREEQDEQPEWAGCVGEKVEECFHGSSGIAETESVSNQTGSYRSKSGLPDRGVSSESIGMKLRLLSVAVVLIAAISARAADPFVLPSHVKELEDLDKAISKAEKEQKGITFLLMEPGST